MSPSWSWSLWESRSNTVGKRGLFPGPRSCRGLRSSHHPNDAVVPLVGPFHHTTWMGAREMIYSSTAWTNLLVLTDWYNGKDLGWNQKLWVQFRAVSWDKFLKVSQLLFSHLKGVRAKWDEIKVPMVTVGHSVHWSPCFFPEGTSNLAMSPLL